MQTVHFARNAGVGNIVLANPPKNLLDRRFIDCLWQSVHEASESDIRVLLVTAAGPNFSFGSDVRDWPGKDINWFRTFIADLNHCYRAIEALPAPTVAAVRGMAAGGAFELVLSCDFIVAAEDAVLRCVEVTTGMLPIAGGLQRIAARAGHARASRFSMLGEPISGRQAGDLGIVSHAVPAAEVDAVVANLAAWLARGPTKSYAATRTLLKAWSAGGVPAADAMMLDVTMDLFNTQDATEGFINTAKAFDLDIEPPEMTFRGR